MTVREASGRPGHDEVAPTDAVVPPRAARLLRWADVAVVLGFVVAAFLLYHPLWMNLAEGYLAHSVEDQNMWEWFFAVTAHSVVNLENPLFTTLQNHPLGVNLMANTVMLGIGVPLTPVTVLFGPTVTWVLTLTAGLAGTAAAWYWVLSRHLVATRVGSAIGAAFCAFAPPIISHATAHPNFVVLLAFPFIVLLLLKLARGERPVRNGVLLGLVVAYQIFLGEEALLIGATTLLVFAAAYGLSRPRELVAALRPLVTGLGVGAGVALVLTAYPLWFQFFGAQSYPGIEHGLRGNDAAAFPAFATQSVAGDAEVARELSLNRTEENAFFGWPLLLLLAVVTVVMWRVVVVRTLAVTAFVMAWLSTGVLLIVDGTGTSIPGPWLALFDEPLFDSVLESRFALGCVPVIGVLLAVATQHVLRLGTGEWRYTWRVVWFAALLVALVPIAPTTMLVERREPTPAFFTEGTWRHYVEAGGSVVAVPLPDVADSEALHWQVEAGLGFPIAEGYFVGPGSDGNGVYGAVKRPTSALLQEVEETGRVPMVTAADRAAAIADVRYWRADVLVLPVWHEEAQALRETVERLLPAPAHVEGEAWVWDVRDLTP